MSLAKIYKGFLSFLSELTVKQFQALLRHFSKDQLTAVREVLANILAGHVHLTPEQKRQLAPYKTFLRRFARYSSKKCLANKNCRALWLAIKAAKKTIDQL